MASYWTTLDPAYNPDDPEELRRAQQVRAQQSGQAGGQQPGGVAGAARAAAGVPQSEAAQREEAQRYQEQIGQLYGLVGQADERFAPSREAQLGAVDVLGQRASTLAQSAALAQMSARRQQLAAQAGQGAILGGQLGAAMAPQMQGIEQEAAARQQAYLRGVQQLGAGLMSEAEQRRAAEAEILRDLQVRYAAAQQAASSERSRQAEQRSNTLGRIFAVGGSVVAAGAGRSK